MSELAAVILPAVASQHDGLYASPRLGVGWLRVRAVDYTLRSGLGTPLGFLAGYAFHDSLVFFGELQHFTILNRDSYESSVTSLRFYGFGPGVKYYFNPVNVFLSGSLLISRISHDTWYGTISTSHWGGAADASAQAKNGGLPPIGDSGSQASCCTDI